MARNPDCIFCKIVAVELPASVVYEDHSVMAFMDIGPLADGHLLVIPREHYQLLVDMPRELCAQVAAVLPKLGRALQAVTGAPAFNVLLNNGEVAGQAVHHAHWHLIPRRPEDGLGYRWNAGKYPPGRIEELAAAYQKALAPETD